ncbi:hypothetical protein Adt_11711 [Abeliophyllum distichum]|uniref:Uncharacterized protein n=1 Tax=Abeliophyllum distichum TaxID=126358 RepID=A0ABD1UP09_9LAMI
MADVMSHEGDGAGDSPQQPPHRLDSTYEYGQSVPDEYRAVCATVDCLAADHYRDYKLKVHNHLKAHGPSRPYGDMSVEDWQKCIDFFTSPNFVGTYPSLDSTAASKPPQGTSHKFSGDSQNDDPRFAMYEVQLRRMQRKIELLKNSIQGVVPEEVEENDGDEGLGDL